MTVTIYYHADGHAFGHGMPLKARTLADAIAELAQDNEVDEILFEFVPEVPAE